MELRNRSVSKSDYTTGGETPAKRRSKKNSGLLNSIEWLIIIFLTLLVLLLSISGDNASGSGAASGKLRYCNNGENFFVPLNKVDCQSDPNAPGCKNTDCKPCPKLGSCNHGGLVKCNDGNMITAKAVRVGDNCVDSRLPHDIRVVEILDQAEEELRKGNSLRRQGFANSGFITYQEVRDRVKQAEPALTEKADWETIFTRVVADHPNVGFVRGTSGFEF